MRKLIIFLAATLFLAFIYFILLRAFPIYAYLLPSLVTMIAMDGYLWYSVKNKISSFVLWKRWIITGLYWISLMTLAIFIIAGFFSPFISWNIILRTYVIGLIAIIYVCKLFPIFFLFLADMTRVVQTGAHLILNAKHWKSKFVKRSNGIMVSGWYLGFAFFLLLLYGMTFGVYDFRVRKEIIKLPELPSSFDGIKIVQFSDVHLGSWTCKDKLKEAVEIINSLHPDIVFFTGDMVNYTSYESFEFASILSKIKPPMGTFVILGNHDYGDYSVWPNAEAKRRNMIYLYDIYKFLDWKLLLNENVILHRGDDSIAVIGVQNWGRSKRFQRLGSLEPAVKGIKNVPVQLLLSHDPSHWDASVNKDYKNIDITFSGHTHGFQFGIDCCGVLWSPLQYMYNEWSGLYTSPVPGSHPQYLYVNRGLGSIGYPGRIGILPEITLFILQR